MDVDARAQRIAAGQHGYLKGTQAYSGGMTEKQLRHRRSSGGWVKVLPDVYRLPGVPETFEGSLMAVQLWMGGDGFFWGPTAAYLFGLDGIDEPRPIEVVRFSGANHPSLKVRRLGRRNAPRLRWHRGFRTASVERILLDVAAALPVRIAGRALDDALRRRLTTLDRLKRFLSEQEDGRGRIGSKPLRMLVEGRDLNDAKVRTVFETRMLRILKRIGAFSIQADYPVEVGGDKYFLDFYIPAARLGIECHSFRWHIGKHNQDARRDRRIKAAGIELLYFTWDDVVLDAEAVEREIRDAIGRRMGQLFGATSG